MIIFAITALFLGMEISYGMDDCRNQEEESCFSTIRPRKPLRVYNFSGIPVEIDEKEPKTLEDLKSPIAKVLYDSLEKEFSEAQRSIPLFLTERSIKNSLEFSDGDGYPLCQKDYSSLYKNYYYFEEKFEDQIFQSNDSFPFTSPHFSWINGPARPSAMVLKTPSQNTDKRKTHSF